MSHTVVNYEGGLRCRSQHFDSGAVVITDAPKDHHGKGESLSPSDLLAVSLGSCILSIMGIAAQSMNLDITGSTATVSKEMANAPRRISRLAVAVHIPHPLTPEQAQRLQAAVHSCPVHNILKPEIDAPITFQWHRA